MKPEIHAPGARTQALRSLLVAIGAIFGVALLLAGLQSAGILHMTLVGFARATGVFIVVLAAAFLGSVVLFGKLTRAERNRVGVIGVCFLAAAIFWSGFEQAGSSMNLFAERLTDRAIFGWEMPASWLQSVNSMFIILLAPLFSALWLWLGSRSPSIPAKFAYGLIQLGLGFLVLAWASLYTANGHLVGPSWLVVTYFLHTTGELCLSPVGLSSITKLSPSRFVGQMMGVWFMGSALGNLIAGLVAGLIASLPLPQLFGTVCLFTAGAGVLLLLFARPIRNMAGDVK